MKQEIIYLYDRYTHSEMDRRTFLERLALLVGSTAMASRVLNQLENNYALAKASDPSLVTENISFSSPFGPVQGFLAQKTPDQKKPGVVVIHENRGLNPYIQDVARQLAQDGFLALAPDALSLKGGTPTDSDQARHLIGELDPDQARSFFVSAIQFLARHTSCQGKVGVVGFCWGGAMANQMAIYSPLLAASVAFYGRQPVAEDVPKIHVPLQLHYGELDERINAGIDSFQTALDEAKKDYAIFRYPEANHAFHNHTNPARYNAQAAQLAWERTLEFFRKHLQ